MPDKPIEPQIEFITPEKYAKMYSNSVNLVVTPWDFTFSFGEIKQPGEKTVIENLVGIVMSPQHAKAFANILISKVHEYEKSIGEIKVPGLASPVEQPATEPPKPH